MTPADGTAVAIPLAVPTLRQLRESRTVAALQRAFREKDDEAVEQQRRLFRMLRIINLLVLAVGVLSGLVLAGTIAQDRLAGGRAAEWRGVVANATWLFGIAITVCGILATVLGQFVRGGDRLARWRALRSEAELARGQVFATLARLAAEAGRGPALEALETVRADLLEDQRAFYARRAREHRVSAGVTSLWTGVSLALSALAGATAVAVLANVSVEWLLVIGVIGAAIGAYAVDRENLLRDRGNADLYERTAERLGALAGGVDRVTAEIQSGSPQAVVAFTDLVVEELQAEHRQWREALAVAQEQLDRLEERLSNARARDRGQPGGAAPAGAARPTTAAAPSSSGSSRDIAGELARWKPLLSAASNVLPPPLGERARVLSSELSTVLAPLDSAAPVSSGIAAAAAFADRLRAENPLGQWLGTALPRLAPVVGAVIPPLGLILGVAGVGARLGEEAYRRWVARVLQAPIAAGLVEPTSLTSTAVLAAMEGAPEFAAAWGPERERQDLAAIVEMGGLVVGDAETLWSREQGRFNGDRAAFDRGVAAMRRTLLDRAVEEDTAGISRAELPEGTTPAQLLDAVSRLQSDPEGRATLQTAVQLVHELRNEGAGDPVAALRLAQGGGAST